MQAAFLYGTNIEHLQIDEKILLLPNNLLGTAVTNSSIEWTDTTWNPAAGCSVISPGCRNCYAMRMAARLEAMGKQKYLGLTKKTGNKVVWTGKINLDRKILRAPRGWKKSRMVFVNSMSDLFHDAVADEFILDAWEEMGRNDRHTFQILTKRAERMFHFTKGLEKIYPNIWLGVSVENSDYFDRLDWLRKTDAFVRFVSFEPLLGSVSDADLADIDWAIIGGESGPKSRPMEPAWVDEIKKSCRKHGTAFFFKQWGGVNKKKAGRELQGRTWDEYPVKGSEEYRLKVA